MPSSRDQAMQKIEEAIEAEASRREAEALAAAEDNLPEVQPFMIWKAGAA
jgi:hypothetical protein